jgi:hypothetical protein
MASLESLESLESVESRILTVGLADWDAATPDPDWSEGVEGGKVLYFPRLGFRMSPQEQGLLGPRLLQPGVRNISLDARGQLKGAAGAPALQAQVGDLTRRFAVQARGLVEALLPQYAPDLRAAPTSLRPVQVAVRRQSWRADDRRLHVDAFSSRPNRGERILRVLPTSARRANRGSGAWASRSRMWRAGSCRALRAIHRSGRACCGPCG